jgi:hypothetical protein
VKDHARAENATDVTDGRLREAARRQPRVHTIGAIAGNIGAGGVTNTMRRGMKHPQANSLSKQAAVQEVPAQKS